MQCIRCRREIPDGSFFCPACGKRQTGKLAPQKRRARRPKGSGSIIKLADRSKPYRAMLCGKLVGYYATRDEAAKALDDARQQGGAGTYYSYTMQQVFDAIMADRAWADKSKNYLRDMRSIWNYMEDIHGIKARECCAADFQDIIYQAADEGRSLSHQQKIRVMAKKLCLWCRQHGLHTVDQAEGLQVSGKVQRARRAFSDEDLRTIYSHRTERAAGIIWFLCMTGCRLADLEKIRKDSRIDIAGQGIWLEGSKTAAGRDRYVKIDPVTWSEVFMRFYLSAAPGQQIFRSPTGGPWDTHNFREREFYPALAAMWIQPMPEKGKPSKYILYTCRHTYATLADRSGVDKAALQRAMGHQIGSDVTDRHYIDRAAQVQDAAQEFAKMADTVRKLAT